MTPTRPYLLRAFYEWIVDNGKTPYIVVDAEASGVKVPEKYIQDGRIILNISPTAVQKLRMGNDLIEFYARFSGVSSHITAPPSAVIAVYAKENGRGMVFAEEEEGTQTEPPTPPSPPKKPTTKSPPSTVTATSNKTAKSSHLKVIK